MNGRIEGVKMCRCLRVHSDSACILPTEGRSSNQSPMSIRKTSTFLLLFAGFLMTLDGLAQENNAVSRSGGARYDEPRFRMGLHLLPSVAWLDVRDAHTRSDGALVRFGFGFTADIMFADNYAIGTGINVFRNGGKLTSFERVTGHPVDEANDSLEFIVQRDRKLTHHWVELPVSFKFRTREVGHITYWGQFGLGLGLNLRATADDRVSYLYRGAEVAGVSSWIPEVEINPQDFSDFPVEDEVALLRASMIVGLGIEYNLSGKTALLLGATFNNGLFNVANNRNFSSSLEREHIEPASVDGILGGASPRGYNRKMVDNAILLSFGLLF